MLHSKFSDLNNIGSDTIHKILEYLTIGEISRSCKTNQVFNFVCRKELLWKNKLHDEYEVNEKNEETWRNTAKNVFLESEEYWSRIDEFIKYYITDISDYGHSQLYKDAAIDDSINIRLLFIQFQCNFVDHALREHKEFYAAELIFKSFYNISVRPFFPEESDFYPNLIPLFQKVAELSPEGKISMKWVLSLNHIQKVKVDIEKCTRLGIYDINSIERDMDLGNINLTKTIRHLSLFYFLHRNLFIDDTDGDQKDIVIVMENLWEGYYDS
uniref:F-box-like family protein n=1 Tax=Pithovirus LCPAC403 TaxID=2506596 RepID=A0A481ZCB6_9VIRU|nr:MAG: F-box-like family protein [Pithovirus LCPAC403]